MSQGYRRVGPWRLRAFNILELLVVLGLFSLLAGLAAINLRGVRRSTSNRAAAELVAAQLRRARSEALRRRSPVALALPSESGTLSSSSGMVRIEGAERPRLRSRIDLASEFPQVCLFAGFWSLQSGHNSNAPPQGGQRDDAFDPAQWQLPNPNDSALIFTPSGMVTSNGAVHFEQAYHWVVCSGVSAAPGNLANQAPTQVNLQQASGFIEPYTVSVSFQGAIRVSPGVVGAGAILRSGIRQAASPPAILALSGNQDPVVDPDLVEILPVTPADSLPPGVVALVPHDRYLTLKLAATDPDGDRLSIRWRLVSGGGGFSQPMDQYLPMEYSHERQRWESSVEWCPPPGTGPGDRFEINADVRDQRGGVTTLGGEVLARLRIGASSDGKLLAARRGSNVVKMFNPDGSGLRELVLGDLICTANSIPDGSRLTFAFWNGPLHGALLSMNSEGLSQSLLYPEITVEPSCEGVFSASGRLATTSIDGLHLRRGDGTFERLLVAANWPRYPAWSPDESKIAYDTGGGDVYVVNVDGTGNHWLTPGRSATWSPDGRRLAVARNDGIFTLKPDGSDVQQVCDCTTPSEGNCLTWSPDSTRVAFPCGGRYISIRNWDGSNEKVVQDIPNADILLWMR